MKNVKFEGILPAIVTPYKEDNKTINEQVAKDLIDFHLSQGANGFYVLGGTGEGVVMAREEREVMAELAVKHVAGRKPVIMHIAAMNLNEAVELAKHAEKVGADAIAALPPFFFGYTEEELYNYYKKLADSVTLPVIIYYHPSAQRNMSADLIAKIFEIDNVTGVKWSADNFYEMMKLKDITHGEMNIINGPDENLIQGLAAGADAGVGATYNIMLPEFVKIYNLFREGKMPEALEVQHRVNRVIGSVLKFGIIPSVKYGTTLLGFDVGDATFPMKALTDEEKAAFEKEIKACGWPFNN